MKRPTVVLIATAGIIIVGAVFLTLRDGGGVSVDTQPAARKAVFKSSVTASGQIVAQRYADIGSSVMGIQGQLGTTLMTVSDLAAIDAEVKVAEADVLRIQLDQRATVTLEAIPGVPFTGRVAEVGASALPISGTGAAAREFRVKVRLDAPDARLRPGLTCDADVLTAERQNVLVVPLQAVVVRTDADGRERTGVFVADDRAVRFQSVTTGLIGGLDIEVSGLNEGTAVVTGPFQALRDLKDGQAVRTRTAS
jgi:HlyD family secretion protein